MPASAYLLLAACLALPYVMRALLSDMRRTAALKSVGRLPMSARVTDGWIPVRVVDAECTEVSHG